MILVTANLLAIPTAFISPYVIKIFIDNFLYGIKADVFLKVIFGLISAYAARFVLDLIILACSNKILNRFTYVLRHDIWKKYFKLSHSEFEKKDVGDLKMRLIDDVDNLGNFLNSQIVEYIFNIFLAAFVFVMLIRTSYKLTLTCITIIPVVFMINHFIGKGMRKINEKIRAVNKEYYTFEHNALQFWKEIKAHNAEHGFIKKFKEYREILAKLGYTQIRYWFYNEIFYDIKTNYISKILIFIAGARYIFNWEITMGTLVMISGLFDILFIALDAVNTKRVELKINLPYYQRIFETLDFDEENDFAKSQIVLDGNIMLKNVSFQYENGVDDVLRNVNLEINKGDYTAIIGKSGCGKTTLIKLMLGLYPVDTGVVRFDGTDVSTISKKSLYSQIGAVMQDSYLFNISIRDNLLLANQYATEEDLNSVCDRVNILDFVLGCPDGFDTIIGEKGIKLSGGQKQRLAIARALLKNPNLIIFDEATSSLDKISEDIINQSINQIAEDTTVIVISHKPSAILKAKRVMRIEKKRL